MNPHRGKQRAFAKFFKQLIALMEDKSQRFIIAYGTGRWAPGKGCVPAPSTRAYKECARYFVTIPVDELRTSYVDHELGCPPPRVEMEKCPWSPEDIKKHGELTEHQMAQRARVGGLLA